MAFASCGGDPDQTVDWVKQAIHLAPQGPPAGPEFYPQGLGIALYFADRCDEAISVIQGLKSKPLESLAACQVRVGQLGQARSTMAEFIKQNPGWTLKSEIAFPFPFAPPLQKRWLDDIGAAGLPEG